MREHYHVEISPVEMTMAVVTRGCLLLRGHKDEWVTRLGERNYYGSLFSRNDKLLVACFWGGIDIWDVASRAETEGIDDRM
jgi:hypothetical protein